MRFAGLLLMVLAVVNSASASDPLDTRVPMRDFQFDGLVLPRSIAEFKMQYPAAVGASYPIDEQVGLVTFVVKKLPAADSATFSFMNGAFYQAEFAYQPERIAAQGGVAAVLRRMVIDFGPPDHVDQVRRTWRLNNEQRADFYARPSGGQLVITNIGLISAVERREKTQQLTGAHELGF